MSCRERLKHHSLTVSGPQRKHPRSGVSDELVCCGYVGREEGGDGGRAIANREGKKGVTV